MTGRRWEIHAIRKDARALLPIWLASAVAIVVAGRMSALAALIPYTLGAAALGALAVGHEYSHRTLSSLLALPLRRWQLLTVKLLLLALMLSALAAVAAGVGLGGLDMTSRVSPWRWLQPAHVDGVTALWLPLLCGLLVAPWLTMVARGPLGGTVFTAGLLAVMWFAGDAVAIVRYGVPSGSFTGVDTFRSLLVWRGGLTACAIAAVAIWPTFARLQATEGSGAALRLPRRRGRGPASVATRADRPAPRRWHWAWHLVVKEVHLHQMVFAVTGLYLVAWLAILWSRRSLPEGFGLPLGPVTWLYGATVAVLVGAFTSAEERQLGTVSGQLLQPVPAWRPWAVKIATALALTLLLATALPHVLERLAQSRLSKFDAVEYWQSPMFVTFLIVGVYVSSFSTNGLTALIVSLPVGALVYTLLTGAFQFLEVSVYQAFVPTFLPGGRPAGGLGAMMDRDTLVVFVTVCLAGTALIPAGIALWCAFVNHRSLERRPGQIVRQALWILIGILLIPVLDGLLFAYLEASRPGHLR